MVVSVAAIYFRAGIVKCEVMGLAVVVPAFREPNIDKFVDKLHASLRGLGVPFTVYVGIPYEDRVSPRPCNAVVVDRPLSIGLALRALFRRALTDGHAFVASCDGDGQHRPEDLLKVIEMVLHGGCGIAVGSRFVLGGYTSQPLWRRILSRGASTLLSLPVMDPTSNMRCYRADVLGSILPHARCKDYSFVPELLMIAWMLGFTICEVPIRFEKRVSGRSKLGIRGLSGYPHLLARRWLKWVLTR